MFTPSKEWCIRMAMAEPDCPISAGVPTERDALWSIQQLAAVGIDATDDSGPLADVFAEIHRTAVSALMSNEPTLNTSDAKTPAAEQEALTAYRSGRP